MPTSKPNPINARLKALRATLKQSKLHGFIVPRTDEFQGEYVPAHAERLQWISGFTGSAGTCIIGLKNAVLIIDGRYTIQAATETKNSGISPANLTPDSLRETFKKLFKPGDHVGFDPWLTPQAETNRMQKLCETLGLVLKAVQQNPIDTIWQDQPAPPAHPVSNHSLRYSGVSANTKIYDIAKALKSLQADATVLNDPLSVAWALNIRGQDVPFTPVALLRAIVTKAAKAILFVDKPRLPTELLKEFGKAVELRHPNQFETSLKQLGRQKSVMAIDPQSCPHAIVQSLLKAGAKIKDAPDLCVMPRATKNPTELKGARAAHARDGAAVCNFLNWISGEATKSKITERQAQDKLADFRKATKKLVDRSFGTISASGPNAALPHYHVTGKTGRTLRKNQIYLIDSGGQYRDGTTDITRTIIIGKATSDMREKFTLVLKGMIAVSTARFPEGTTGAQIDALARAALWQHGLDFDHGTGHGVGSFLSVHEGPARISKTSHIPLQPGMILSNEPGFYRPGHFGIRIENLLVVKPAQKQKGHERSMLSFETLSFVPIDRNLIETKLLTRTELIWLDDYHAKAFALHQAKVEPSTRVWLEAACAKIT
jgi:Xaa-Pro aminopeptidase